MKHLRPHLDLLKALGCTVLVFTETSNAIHGDRGKPLTEGPVLAAADWAKFGQRMTEVADFAKACVSSTTITWARWSKARPRSMP